jgi:2-dehydro-3-deoxygluconokinase
VFARLLARRSKGTTVMTLGPKGAMASDGRRTVRVGSTSTEGVGRLGAGDAFSAGFLFGWLQDWDLELSLRWANAAAQNKMTTPGDLPCFTKKELESLVEGSQGIRLLR